MAPNKKVKKSTKHKSNVVRTRKQYCITLKLQAINMHLAGKSNREIIKHIKEKWYKTVSSSTVSTWYTPASIEKLKKLPEGSIIGQYLPDGSRKAELKKLSASVIEQHLSGITDDRLPINCVVCKVSFTDPQQLIQHLNVEHVIPNDSTSDTTINCVVCKVSFTDPQQLIQHLNVEHVIPNDSTSDTTGDANVHNVRTTGEKGSSDYLGAQEFCEYLIPHLLECHKCYENVLNTDRFMELYNAKHNTAFTWPGDSFRGFKKDEEMNYKAQMLSDLLKEEDVYKFECEDIKETIVYDPNTDVSVNGCIEEGFARLRLQAGISDSDDEGDASDEEDAEEVVKEKALKDSYKALLNFCISPGMRYINKTDKQEFTKMQDHLRLKFVKYIQPSTIATTQPSTLQNPQPSTSRMGASPMEDISDTSLPSLNNDNDNSYASLDDITYDDTIVVLNDADYERDSSIDVTTITEADRDDAARAVTPPPPQREEADVITPPMKPISPSSRSLTGSPMHTDAPVTHFRARPPRSIASRYWEGKYADQSSDDFQESSQESMYVPVLDKTEESD